jgi:ribosomal protein S18 acetylase RimI-like enzyme
MKIVFTGDLFLGGDLYKKDTSDVVNSAVFKQADIRVINLEQPISDRGKVAEKCTLYTGSYATQQLRQLNVQAVNLAHNHIQDKSDDGIVETIEHLSDAGIDCFGAGDNLTTAKKPYWIKKDLCIIGYCDYDRPTLTQIRLATDNEPGINPLRYESINRDLENLPVDSKAILYFHWGREHVWLPQYQNILLAKKLLKNEKVLGIIGMHAHLIQGYVEYNGKRAYMCLGNFLFPNFFIEPPVQMSYPTKLVDKYDVTRLYHRVSSLTYKKWKLVNRISLIINYDTEIGEWRTIPMMQNDDEPGVKELGGVLKALVMTWVLILSSLYLLPRNIYVPLEKVHVFLTHKICRMRIRIFHVKQQGVARTLKKALRLVIAMCKVLKKRLIIRYFFNASQDDSLSDIYVKTMTLKDVDHTAAMHEDSSNKLEVFTRRLESPNWIGTVAVDSRTGQAVGYQWVVFPTGNKAIWHDSLPVKKGEACSANHFVRPAYRGKGINRILTQHVVNSLKESDISSCFAVIENKNKASLKSSLSIGSKEAVNYLVKLLGRNIFSIIIGHKSIAVHFIWRKKQL